MALVSIRIHHHAYALLVYADIDIRIGHDRVAVIVYDTRLRAVDMYMLRAERLDMRVLVYRLVEHIYRHLCSLDDIEWLHDNHIHITIAH